MCDLFLLIYCAHQWELQSVELFPKSPHQAYSQTHISLVSVGAKALPGIVHFQFQAL